MMPLSQQIITIFVVIAVTVFTRAVAFWIFPEGKQTPPFIHYLGKALPPAVFGMLMIYCLKDIDILTGNHGLPELLSIGFICILHFWKKNMLLSIAGGTICYMLLTSFVF